MKKVVAQRGYSNSQRRRHQRTAAALAFLGYRRKRCAGGLVA
jgi:hypothetical protein